MLASVFDVVSLHRVAVARALRRGQRERLVVLVPLRARELQALHARGGDDVRALLAQRLGGGGLVRDQPLRLGALAAERGVALAQIAHLGVHGGGFGARHRRVAFPALERRLGLLRGGARLLGRLGQARELSLVLRDVRLRAPLRARDVARALEVELLGELRALLRELGAFLRRALQRRQVVRLVLADVLDAHGLGKGGVHLVLHGVYLGVHRLDGGARRGARALRRLERGERLV